MRQPRVVIRGLSKRFGDTVALDGLDLDVSAGEVVGVAGPNGAGKSTMINILSDLVKHDSGEIFIDGSPWTPQISARGIAVVHQEPQLFPNLTVGENLAIGRERSRLTRTGLSDDDLMLLKSMSIHEFIDSELSGQPLAVQQRVEIARALAQEASVLLFDEPNSALTADESDDLFCRMRQLAQQGKAVLLVSHRLAELVAHTDRVVVVRDGCVAAELVGDNLSKDRIARELVVRAAAANGARNRSPAEARRPSTVVLSLAGWRHKRSVFRKLDLDVRSGEIVVIAGVEGSGARQLVRSIAGFAEVDGTAELRGTPVDPARASIAFVAADRAVSLFSNLSVEENLVIRMREGVVGRGGFIRRRAVRRQAAQLAERYRVKVASVGAPIASLSGGNQQKVAIAAAMATTPALLVLEEPTRGVDIESKVEIYRLLHSYVSDGGGVVLYCTEDSEIFEIADLVYVVSDGILSAPRKVVDYEDVDALASELVALEEHRPDAALLASSA